MSKLLIVLPGPVSIRPDDYAFADQGGTLRFQTRDAAHADAIAALLRTAVAGGYSVEMKLLHYEGHPDKYGQDAARKEAKQ